MLTFAEQHGRASWSHVLTFAEQHGRASWCSTSRRRPSGVDRAGHAGALGTLDANQGALNNATFTLVGSWIGRAG